MSCLFHTPYILSLGAGGYVLGVGVCRVGATIHINEARAASVLHESCINPESLSFEELGLHCWFSRAIAVPSLLHMLFYMLECQSTPNDYLYRLHHWCDG